MSNTIVLNSSNVVGSNNNTFQFNFIQGNFKVSDAELAISNITIPYSWYNVSSYYNNQSFQFTWTVAGVTTTYTVTLPAGFYSVVDINNYLEQYFIANGMYLVDSNSNNVYYIQLQYNTTYYAVQLLTFAVPTSLPTGYTQPSNWLGYPTVTTAPSFIVSGTNTFGSLIGFTAGTYGGGSTNKSTLSNTTPLGTNVNSVIVRCNLVNNSVASPTDILDSFPITSTFGSNINYTPNYEKWIKMKSGTYSNIIVSFWDQNLNPIIALDPNVLITLLIRQK
jgi:hypothetical protein